MTATIVRRFLVVCAILVLPVAGFAQEATLSGNVTDSTGGVLPGVTVTAVHEASGNTFEAVGSFSSCRAGSTRRRGARPACR